jgi:hypothetical protein
MQIFRMMAVLFNQVVLFIFLEHASFVNGHRESLVCTQWKAGFVVTPEVSHQSPLLEIFYTFFCAAIGLALPLTHMWSHSIHFQTVQPVLKRLPAAAARIRRFLVAVREQGRLFSRSSQYIVVPLLGIILSGLWLWRYLMA